MTHLECPGNSIHRYNISDNRSKCYPLNVEFINYLNNAGIYIEEKIGQGTYSDVFKVRLNNGIKAALIIISNTESNFDITNKLIKAKAHPDIFPIIYGHFKVNIPYSLDSEYLQSSFNFGERTIQVIELMDMTLDKYIEEAIKIYKSNIWSLIDSIFQIIKHLLLEMYNNGIIYYDTKLDNIGVIYSGSEARIKFIDIESMQLSSSYPYKFNPEGAADAFFEEDLKPFVETKLMLE